MRVCLIYDCLFPYTVGGAERWYRNLGLRLAAEGHDVVYLTLRQWPQGVRPELDGVTVRTVGPRIGLYASSGRRRVLPPLIFALGVLWHLSRHGRRYDVVHTASFPYFPLLAVGLLRRRGRYRLVVDWHEVWTRTYWRAYLGRVGGEIGWLVQFVCIRIPQSAFCFSRLHAGRLRKEGFRGDLEVLSGLYAGSLELRRPQSADPVVVFVGRFIPEKQVPTLVPAVGLARRSRATLTACLYGDGPEREQVRKEVALAGLNGVVRLPGFVESDTIERALACALCLILPSRREGYGLVVVEAASYGTPSIVVAGEDNAAVERIMEGVNGFVASSAAPDDLARAILQVSEAGDRLRETTADWFAQNASQLSLEASLNAVNRAYSASDFRFGTVGVRG